MWAGVVDVRVGAHAQIPPTHVVAVSAGVHPAGFVTTWTARPGGSADRQLRATVITLAASMVTMGGRLNETTPRTRVRSIS
jgi:hypothetical protein